MPFASSLEEIAAEVENEAAQALRDDIPEFEWQRSTLADLADYDAAQTHSWVDDPTGESQRLVANYCSLERALDDLKRKIESSMKRAASDAAHVKKCRTKFREMVVEAVAKKQQYLAEWRPTWRMQLGPF